MRPCWISLAPRRSLRRHLRPKDRLYRARFAIEKVAGWEAYGPDIYAEQNVTVGYSPAMAGDGEASARPGRITCIFRR